MAMQEKLVQPIMTNRIYRGIGGVLECANVLTSRLKKEGILPFDNPQDQAEFDEAMIWLERYRNWHNQRI